MKLNQLRFFLCGALLGLLTACGGGGASYYRLDATAPATGGGRSGLSVAVGPVSLPSYIDRSEIVFATGTNEFQVPADALWIGSLQENISRAVAADLGRLLGSGNVRAGSEPRFNPRYRVALDVRRFHGISGQGAILDLSWSIRSGNGEVISRHSAVFHEQIVGDGYGPLVSAESRLLAQAADAIARSLR
ncbi:MAG: membrane integrity-associated transporter subunit PqiC [Chthoniobacterales bacterium]|nr:membrane integrity-associated transporter subunit PqiC [Chthoniobacterales bacterium]